MTMMERGALIESLTARDFKPGKPQNYGWTFQHADGFKLEFDASGRFTLALPDGTTQRGVMSKPEDVLAIIDNAASLN